MCKTKQCVSHKSAILFSTFVTVLLAQNYPDTTVKQVSPEKIFKYCVIDIKNKSMDHPELGVSGRAYWIEELAGLSKRYIEKGLDTEPIFKELSNVLLTDPYPYNRLVAARGISLTKKEESFELLSKALGDTSLFVRNQVALSIVNLGHTKDMNALKVLAETATKKNLETMSIKELIAAGENPTLLYVKAQTKGIDYPSKIAKRNIKRAIEGLHKGSTNYSKKILESLKNDTDSDIRNWANGKEM